ncbi:MAG: MATE family efflux transporter [Coriobacteriales bacterium]
MNAEVEEVEESEADLSKIDRMGTAPMTKLLIQYSLPSIAGLIVVALYGLVDGIFIGIGVGDAGIAATAVSMPFMTITMALNTLIGNGGNILSSIRLGEGKHAEAERSLGNTVALMFVAYVLVLCICLPLIDPILVISGATSACYDYAKTYMAIMIIGFIFNGLSGGIGNFIRTAGSPNVQMGLMIFASLANIVFDYFAVIVFQWGIAGAAWATVLSQIIATILTLWFFARKKATIRLRLKYMKFKGAMVKDILRIGLAGFFMNALMAITSILVNQLLLHYGDMDAITGTGALAAFGASGRVQNIIFQIIVGISAAAQPILGYNYGAGLLRRLKSCFWTSSNIGFVGLLIVTVIVEVWPYPLLTLFNLSPEVFGFAAYTLRVMTCLLPLAAYGIISSTYFMATNQALKANILVLLRQIFLLVPIMILCPIVLPMMFGISPVGSILWAYPIVDAISTTISMIVMSRDLKKLNARIANGEDAIDREAALETENIAAA